MNQKTSRRTFLQQTAVGAGIGIALIGCSGSDAGTADDVRTKRPSKGVLTGDVRVIVFQGDSITDAGRSKDNQQANVPHALGSGYVAIAVAQLLGENPGTPCQCYNRGISGNKVHQLAERWREDALQLQPDVLSILIGVNDFWHTLTGGYEGTVETYEREYRSLLDQTREALPDVMLIVGEPFAVSGGTAIDEQWHPAFDAYRDAALRVARDYEAVWIPYQQLFDEAVEQSPAAFWAPDGVHPAPAGNYLMAQAWLGALEDALGEPRPQSSAG